MSALNTYGVDKNLSAEQWIVVIRGWPALVRATYLSLLFAGCELGAARRLARGRHAREEACGYNSDLIALIVREQRKRAQVAVRKAIYALALIRALHPKASA